MRPCDWYLSEFDFFIFLIDGWCSISKCVIGFKHLWGSVFSDEKLECVAKFRFASVLSFFFRKNTLNFVIKSTMLNAGKNENLERIDAVFF